MKRILVSLLVLTLLGGNAFAEIPDGFLNALYITAFFGFGVKAAVFPFSRGYAYKLGAVLGRPGDVFGRFVSSEPLI